MVPIVVVQVYLLLTVLLFRYGPWQYLTRDSNEVLGFALLYQLALLIGYLVAHTLYRPPVPAGVDVRQLLTLSIVANLLLFVPTSLARTGALLPNVLAGLRDPGSAYASSFEYRSTGAGAAIEYVRVLLGPLLYVYFPLAIFYWRFLGLKTRGLTLVLIVLTISLFVAMGTNKAIGDYAITVPLLMLTAACAGHLRLTLRRGLAALAVVIALGGLFSSFFTATMESREGSYIAGGYFPPGNTRVDPDNALLQATPPGAQTLLLGLSSYVTQGYFAMSLALREPFVPLYGLGTSPFVLRQYETLTGTEALDTLTYPARIEKYGWIEERYWSSIYVWLASDLSFWGIPFFCFLLGMVLYTTWRDSTQARDPWAVALLSLNFIVLLYFSSNNQIGQSGEALATYAVISVLWLTSRFGLRFVFSSKETR